jgi:hypothetical protein
VSGFFFLEYEPCMILMPIRGVVGILASIEHFMSDADERDNAYLFTLVEKHQARLKGVFDRHVVRDKFA